MGEGRILGLLTTQAYSERASRIPVLRRKLARILREEDLFEGSHDYKAAVAAFESFPKDELFDADTADLRRAVVALLELGAPAASAVRPPRPDERSVSLMVALPRARFTPTLQELRTCFVALRGPASTTTSPWERPTAPVISSSTSPTAASRTSPSETSKRRSWPSPGPGTIACASCWRVSTARAGPRPRRALGPPVPRVLQASIRPAPRGDRRGVCSSGWRAAMSAVIVGLPERTDRGREPDPARHLPQGRQDPALGRDAHLEDLGLEVVEEVRRSCWAATARRTCTTSASWAPTVALRPCGDRRTDRRLDPGGVDRRDRVGLR